MATDPSHAQPATVSNPGKSGARWNDYKHDQLQQLRTAVDHAAILHSRAPRRISQAQAALAKVPPPPAGAPPEQGSIDHYHALERMLDEVAFYPAHDKRTESPAYSKVHHQMAVVEDRRCLACGVKNSTLKDPAQNPFGAIHMETHHHTIEWALANAVDPDKFNQHVRPGLLRQAQQRKTQPGYDKNSIYAEFDDDYEQDMSADRIKQWVDHSPDNLWVLCDVHHRHKFVGIHAITFPIWGPQDVVDQGLVQKEIEQTKKAAKSDQASSGDNGGG